MNPLEDLNYMSSTVFCKKLHEEYLEPSLASDMELFKEIANSFKSFLKFAKSSILDYLTESWIWLCIYWEVNYLSHREKWEKNCASIFNAITKCVPLTIYFHLYFLCISKVWSMLHHRSVGQVQIKECYFIFTYTFVTFFCCLP